MAQLRKDIEDGNSSMDDLKRRYTLSAEAITYLTKQMKAQAEAQRETEAESKKVAAAAQAHADAIQKLSDRMFGEGAISAAKDYVAALGPMSNLTRMSAEEQTKLNTALGTALEAYGRMGKSGPDAMRAIYMATLPLPAITTGLGEEWTRVGEKVHVSVETILADLAKVKSQEEKNQEFYREIDALAGQAFKTAADGATAAAAATDTASAAARQYVITLQNMSSAQMEATARMHEFDAEQNRTRGGGGAFWSASEIASQQEAMARKLHEQAGIARQREAYVSGAGQAWGTSNTLNVNVNNADARTIADRLAAEMRHQGVRF
jgi:hypothetical protein